METGIACFARGALLPNVSSQHSAAIVSPRSVSSSLTSKVTIHPCTYFYLVKISKNVKFTFLLKERAFTKY